MPDFFPCVVSGEVVNDYSYPGEQALVYLAIAIGTVFMLWN